MSKYVVQRAVSGLGSKVNWFDWKSFDDRDRAIFCRDTDLQQQEARIRGRGGSGYTMERIQAVRVVELVD